MSLAVLSPGLYSLLVDHGRPAARALGVPVGGAADRAALALGNALVGNPPAAAALELTLAGPTLRADHPTAAVVFGAPFALSVNSRPTAAGTPFLLHPGDVLVVGGTPTGARGYLCVAGGFDAPAVLGSRSGLDPVTAGDVLTCRPSAGVARRSLPFQSFDESDASVLRAVDGPQRDWFPAAGFFGVAYTVAPASNRMGVRLAGDPLPRRPGELASEAVAPGAVQVTNDGLPVVLGADGQTIGGYPKVAHVVRADLDKLAQLRPGAAVRFERVTHREAEEVATERARRLREWLVRLAL
jgi:biotin-dependent carboxylase-like uncharacterized protein